MSMVNEAEVVTPLEVSSREEQLVVFRLETESYGIDIFRVNEIIRLREITTVPHSDPHIRGLVNLRGKTIPVVDLRVRFCLGHTEETDNSRIIVVETGMGNIGVIVDEVREVITIQSNTIEPTPPLVSGISNEFVRGVANRGGSLVTLLDLDKNVGSIRTSTE